MNEKLSDVVFVIEGERLPAIKTLLMVKNTVFRVMFSDNFKESKDKEIVIKETTFEAFKALIWFLYSEQLDLKDNNDFVLIGEICKLGDKYEALRLMDRIEKHLLELIDNLLKTKMDFYFTFRRLKSILRIAKEYKFKEVMSKALKVIDDNFDYFMKNNNKYLHELNELTDNQFFELMANKWRKE